MQYRSCNN